ncbi:DUF3823 domain-containing protein [Pedobacter endophyticus]|uniref:DUF3823 domain-containing protein n=1 Tax=Pedobacter endophyticus TaxID=2789740 RepID=A0A7S9L2T5_9SPHI|nr:DUF3823 domain-containing protein [Pedobacter endophyticus]QPH41432.1 DUF3823 domain-containing protein [Pedobacter endophyticus]
MRKYYNTIYVLFICISLAACKKDNYDAPNSSISGAIIDATTGQKVPQQVVAGAKIRLFEVSYSNNPGQVTSSMHADGTYNNNFIFKGRYKVVAEGAFFYLDTAYVDVNGTTRQDLKVRPYLTVTAEVVSKTSTSVTVKVKVALGAGNTQKIARVAAVLSTTPGVDINNYISTRGLTNTEPVANATVEANSYTYTMAGLTPNTKYYWRGGARTINTGNFYNYTPIMDITTDP